MKAMSGPCTGLDRSPLGTRRRRPRPDQSPWLSRVGLAGMRVRRLCVRADTREARESEHAADQLDPLVGNAEVQQLLRGDRCGRHVRNVGGLGRHRKQG